MYNYHIVDILTKKRVSAKSIVQTGDWQFLQLGHYTTLVPWQITEGATAKLGFQSTDITYTAGNGLEINYDYTNQLFRPQQLDDLYFSEIRFKTRCSKQNGYADVQVDVPTATFNPVQGSTFGIPRGAGVEQFVSIDGGIFVGQEMIDNGFEINFTAGNGDFEVYDVSILTCRMGGDKT